MRMPPLLPLLLSSIAMPAAAADYSSICATAADSMSCLIEHVEFARERNAEANASIARVEARRARQLALSLTHCKSRYSRTPRCMAERAQRFADQQNALTQASIVRVAQVRAYEAARNAEIVASIAAVAAERQRQLEIAQNALIEVSLVAVESERQRRFAAYQNALATASVIRVEIERNRQLAISLSACKSGADQRPRCIAQRDREFAAQQNGLAAASVARVNAERERTFATARNAEIVASIAAVARNRSQTIAYTISHCAQNETTPRCEAERARELQASLTHCRSAFDASPRCETERNASNSITTASVERPAVLSAAEYAALTSHCVRAPQSPRCEAERIRAFAAARNAEIQRSITAVERNRASYSHDNLIDTSAICVPYNCKIQQTERAPTLNAAQYAALTSHCVRVPQSPRCEAERIREFAAARNAEIDASIAAVDAARTSTHETASTIANETGTFANDTPYGDNASSLETGALGVPMLPEALSLPDNELRHDISADPCRGAGSPFGPLHFTNGLNVDAAMHPELDRLAGLALTCPGMRIEIHGYTDGKSSSFVDRSLSQARAQAVANYLIATGVAPNRLATIGRGALAPVLPYSKGVDPAYARRVEFVIRDPGMDAAARKVMWDLAELLDPTYVPAVASISP